MISAAYLHVPFCRHRCGYCDFTLVAGRDDLVNRYLDALELEILQDENRDAPLTTLFLGGGTPTHPEPHQLRQLFETIHRHFTFAEHAEISIEANPLDLTDEKIDLLADAGVNRISLGVQSFDGNALTLLERDHSPRDIADCVARLRRRIDNISLDLIFGVPGQSLESWRDTLRQACDLQPTHISTYGLTWEEGTSFFTRRLRGELREIQDTLERDQYALAMDLLAAAGYEQYEISNLARPGFRCRHNLVYWQGEEYLAYGPGAARYVDGRRETNIRSVIGWLNCLECGETPVTETEELTADHRARELVYLGLRLIEGVEFSRFQQRTGHDLRSFSAEAIRRTAERGWIELTDTHLRLNRDGRFLADRVIAEFL